MTLAHRRPSAASARDGERGAVIVLVALTVSVLVTATAFTVDLGRISTERRNLQKTADVAALDLSRRIDGRTAGEILADPEWDAALQASLARNGFDGGTQTVALGSWDPRTEAFTPASAAQVPTAVRVELGSTVDFAFAPGSSSPSRSAVAAQTASAGHQVGSFAARLDTGRSALLGALVGDALGVTVAGYDGLAGAQVSLPLLLDELGLSVGDVDEVAATDVTVAQLVQAEADVLRRQGDLAQADLLDGVVLALPTPDEVIRLDQLVSIAPGGEEAAALASIDAADLLDATAFLANGSNLLAIPAASISVAGETASVTTTAQVIEKPRWAFGPVGTVARTAQATLSVEVRVVVPGTSDTRIEVRLQAVSATAASTAIGCRSPQALDIGADTALATTRADITSRLSVLGAPVADVVLHATTSAPPGSTPVAFELPPDVFGVPVQAATSTSSIGTAAVVTDEVTVLGLPVDGGVEPLVGALTSGVITPVLTQVEATVLQPLADALGLTVAGADVAPLAVACSGPKLVG